MTWSGDQGKESPSSAAVDRQVRGQTDIDTGNTRGGSGSGRTGKLAVDAHVCFSLMQDNFTMGAIGVAFPPSFASNQFGSCIISEIYFSCAPDVKVGMLNNVVYFRYNNALILN